jgi:hypothetical protein
MLETGAAKNIGTYSEFIIGLPLETLETWKQGFDHVLEMGQHNALEVWPCQLLENTELNSFESRMKYGIKSVLAQDYMPYHNLDDHTDIVENILLVTQTNTMSKADMVEGFVYGWMIMLFHYQGYTKLTSQWSRKVNNVAYRKFYDRLYELIHTDPFFSPLVDYLKVNIKHYLDNGYFIDQQMAGHTITYTHHKLVYENKEIAYDLARQCAATFAEDVDQIDQLQRLALYDSKLTLPMSITVPWDIHSWTAQAADYTISTNMVINQDLDFYIARRTGVLYNIFTKTSK